MNYLIELNIIFREILENDLIDLTNSTTFNDIDEWDSINHIYLVDEIEKHFGIKFLSSEIIAWNNVGEIIESVKTKKSK